MRASQRQQKKKSLSGIPAGGVCTVNEPWLIGTNKCQSAVNMMLLKSPDGRGGWRKQWRTRPGLVKASNSPLPDGGAVKAMARLKGVNYLASTANLYRLDGNGDPQSIGAVAGTPELIPFGGLMAVLDGSYLKAVDPDDSFAYGVLYDLDGRLWDWLSEEQAGSWELFDGGMTRAGFKITTQAWGPGSIPLSQVKAVMHKTGSPTGDITFQIWSADGATLLGSAILDAATLGTGPLQQEVDLLAEAGQSLDTSAETVRYVTVDYSEGDDSNKVHLNYAAASAEGKAVTYTGLWAEDSAKDAIMSLGPGLPPRADLGDIKDERLVVGGGDWPLDEDKAKAGYSGPNDPYRWGSREENGGLAGWIGIERGRGGSINGMCKYFDDLYISKTGEASMHRLSGKTPGEDGDWRRDEVFKNLGALAGRTMFDVGNNILFLADQVLGLQGVQGYGDVRQWPKSEDIANLVEAHKSANAFACFHAPHDQYWLQLEGLPYTLVFHVLLGEWSFYVWEGFDPACFVHQENETYLGGDDGFLYQVDDSVIGQDGGREWSQCEVWGPMIDMGASALDKHIHGYSYLMTARMGAQAKLKFRLDYEKTNRDNLEQTLSAPIASDVTVKELTLPVEDWLYPPTGQATSLKHHDHQFVAKAVQTGITGIDPGGEHVYLGPLKIQMAILGVS